MKKLLTGIGIILISLATANAQLFSFMGVSGSASDNPLEGAAVSGTVEVNAGAGTVAISINNDGAGFITGFAFLNSPSMSDRPNTDELTWSPSSNNLDGGRTWTDVMFDNYWQSDEPYYGSVADNPKPGNAIQNGELGALYTFTSTSGDLAALASKWATNDPTPVWSSNNPTSDMLFRIQGTLGPEGSDKMAVNLVAVPEPSTYGIIGVAALVFLVVARRLRKV